MFLELKPGQVISEMELAQVLHISRTPIREVLTKLSEENLVEVVPQVGTYVTKINPQLIEEAVFMRFTLEKEVMKIACQEFPSEHLRSLKNNLNIQELLIGQKDKEREFHRLDNEFHYIIFHGLQKENVWSSLIRISTHYNRIRILSEIENSFDEAIREHKEIVSIIENGKVDQVENMTRKHIIDSMKLWDKLKEPDSPFVDYFDNKNMNYNKMPAY